METKAEHGRLFSFSRSSALLPPLSLSLSLRSIPLSVVAFSSVVRLLVFAQRLFQDRTALIGPSMKRTASFVILETVGFCRCHLSLGQPPSILYSDHRPRSAVIFLAARDARRANLDGLADRADSGPKFFVPLALDRFRGPRGTEDRREPLIPGGIAPNLAKIGREPTSLRSSRDPDLLAISPGRKKVDRWPKEPDKESLGRRDFPKRASRSKVSNDVDYRGVDDNRGR